ncbi:maestro heat-like repeat-containing protein family member 1 isoform X2 [Hemicordylus capensis]|uniref:maestro heat-like repeat-containing protein family member 1 isoform X2 n=1 Tax=Hemicordylus capensis TaxID=884348 RepID=UPI00230239D9|nr:maestro heat-like repeat-containing protein family member 1 isoform X2 [Hemicordylus capensis]XP_053100906.1 maestro heat-like repeat-containing protein family member 1 isoform X2 [Hemicordylus capensis]XP_053100907.1 maestro heat-like repeat-containing protein family member 1 isoform X2 [Hemicordylus capensis]XP_053100908.1 maestro heat-like repeat-containing protein family member 1 isoform X2 [Hemicordylus capensis]XP_053100909.1 maestro heat-like repeat-containing protein family member 1 
MTDSRVKRLAMTLMDATTDKDPLVHEQIFSALCYLGAAEPEEILNACEEYLRHHDKLAYPHRIIILRAMEAVVKSSLPHLDKSTAKIAIFLASNEMTKSKDLILEWQQAASNVLVAVGRRFINKVMEEVLTKFQPGVLPHYFIVQTFANLSLANVFGMVPFLNSILGTMLPMLGMAKQENMKAAFCYALQSFSESIQEYLANLDKAPDPTVRRDTFSSEISSAYEVLFNSWLQSREAKLRVAVVEALGPMSHLMPSEKLEEQLPRLLPGLLALYRRPSEAYYVSKSLCQILEASVDVGSRSLDTQLDALLSALQLQICTPLDSSMSVQLKNHNEVLRCFTVLASSFPDRLLGFLLPKLESGSERARVGTLTILRQVINSASSQMEIKKPFILSAMKLPLQDNSNKVKRAVVQLISAMAHHGYLEQAGGEALVEFLIRQCALPGDQSSQLPRRHSLETEDLTDSHVRDISVNTLFLLSTTVDRMDDVLWPFLLEFVIPVHLSNALAPLCKSLVYLAAKKQEEGEEDLRLHYEANGSLPSAYALLGRLLVATSQPYRGGGQGAAALRLLGVLHLSIHKTLEPLWSKKIPALVEHLEANTQATLSQAAWEDQLLKFLQETLMTISDATWTCQLTLEMCRQLSSYNGSSSEKNFLYKSIGTSLAACANKDLVRKQLQDLLETARYHEEAEREGLASCLGLCAVNYLDETLAKLEEFVKSDVFRKSAGLFSIFKDRSDHEVEKVKSALILCYGYVARHAPQELVLARVDADILRNIFLYFNTKVLGIKVETKDLTLKLCLVRSICMICQAVSHSAQAGDFSFSRKAELVSQMLDFIKAEPLDSLRTPVRQRVMAACMYLVLLEPPLSEAGRAELVKTCLHSVLGLPSPEGPGLEAGQKEPLWQDTLDALKDLLKSLLQRRMTPPGLQALFEHLGPWIRSTKEHERERALEVSAAVLAFYQEKLNVSAVVPFSTLGLLMALFCPRCTDSLAWVRQHAVDCVYSLLYIQLCYEGFSRDHRDESVEKLKALKLALRDPSVDTLFQACCNIAKVIAKRLPPDQLLSLLLAMLEGLADPDSNCSRAAAVMINSLLKERGGVLLEKVPEILVAVHAQLQEGAEGHVQRAAQQTVYILASQHKAAVVSSLLSHPLPSDSSTGTMWQALAREPILAGQVLELLLEKVNRDVPYKENKSFLRGSSTERVATFLPLSATCALHEIMSVPESGPAVVGLYAQLFVALLLRVSCTVGVQLPKNMQSKERKSVGRGQPPRTLDPCSSAVETLKAMLTQGGSQEVTRALAEAGGWDLLRSTEKHPEGVALLARAMAQHAGPRLPPIVKSLAPMFNSIYDSQRVTTTAFFAELLNSNVVNDLVLLESIMDSMTARQRDPCLPVRMLALRGLGNMASGSPEKVRQHGAQLLASMINGMDDKDDPHNLVALEAMSGLSKLLAFTDERDLRSMLLHIAIRIRPFFDSEKPDLRKSSIILFGNLTKFSTGSCEEAFFEQILNGLVTLLLHLQDPKPEVVKACKFALRMCGPSMGCAVLCDMFQNHLHEDRSLHYGEFMNDVCKHLMQNYPDTLNRLVAANLFYFKSSWADIRAAAPMFVGFLVLHVDQAHGHQLDLDELIAALTVLLKDPVTAVRVKVAETLGRLVTIV